MDIRKSNLTKNYSNDVRKRKKYTEENENNKVSVKDKEVKLFATEKVFQNRDSLLTEMFKIPHVNAILNMFLAFMILLILSTVLFDWLDKGILNHLHHLLWVADEFAKPLQVISTILLLYIICLLIFLCLKCWICLQQQFFKIRIAIDILFFLVYLLHFSFILYVPFYVAKYIVLPPCSASFVVYEQVRLIMKLHAYVRYSIPKIIDREMKNKKEILSLKRYLYYMIIPTLVYRDSYPKREIIRFRFVLTSALQFVLCITFMYNIFIVFMRDNFVDFNPSFWKLEVLYRKFFHSILPTILMMFAMFFCFLHVWLNMFAELTKFGDRLFYDDWWNATSLSDYYRTWNVLVHDWLYNYIYKDIVRIFYLLTCNKNISKAFGSVSVFLLSAIVHEYILAYCFRFFYPILLLVFFIFGSSLYFLKAKRTSRISNVLLWTCLFLGNSIFMTLYSYEWYARRNCPRTVKGYMDYFIPRSIFCGKV